MRLEEFSLRVPGDEFRIRFHDQLTVLAGVGAAERQALIDSLVGAMTGDADDTIVTGTDHTGRPFEMTTLGGRVQVRFLDDGSGAPAPIGWFAPDAETLRRLVVLGADRLGLSPGVHDRPDDTPEITEARTTLRELSTQLDAAEDARARASAAKRELDALDEKIRVAESNAARHEYAQALARLERVRSEAKLVDGGARSSTLDRRLLDAMPQIEELSARWREAAGAAAVARGEGLGDIDPAELGRWADVPDAPPADLDALLARVAADEAAVATLERRVRDLASETMPEPEDMRVLTLATIDQRMLWEVHRRLVWAEEAVEREQLALGGLGTGDAESAAIDELEAAHQRVEDATAELERRRPAVLATVVVLVFAALVVAGGASLLALLLVLAAAGLAWWALVPLNGALRAATADERVVLDRLQIPTYLAFHLRRVDATLDPTSQDRLEVARAEAALARRSWESIAGSADPAVAAALEPEIRSYATALRERGGAVDELAQLHRELDEVAQPALRRSQDAIVEALVPYGIGWEDIAGLGAASVAQLVSSRVALGAAARGQRAVVDAEAEEEKLAGRLEEVLDRVGISDGTLEDRLAAAAWNAQQAEEREAMREAARSRDEIELDLTALEAEVRRLERPEFGVVRLEEAAELDLDALLAERRAVQAVLTEAEPLLADLDRLADRHAAMERRVAALVQANDTGDGDGADLAELHQQLLAHFTMATQAGPRSEPLPVVLDEPFVRVPAERKWELMDLVRRLAEKTQVLYVTDDPFVGAWARRRADTGAIRLLEPVE